MNVLGGGRGQGAGQAVVCRVYAGCLCWMGLQGQMKCMAVRWRRESGYGCGCLGMWWGELRTGRGGCQLLQGAIAG